MAREGLMDDCGYEPYVDEDAWNDGFKEGFLMAIDEFAEKLKWEYENSIGIPQREINFAKAVIDQVAERLKGEREDDCKKPRWN